MSKQFLLLQYQPPFQVLDNKWNLIKLERFFSNMIMKFFLFLSLIQNICKDFISVTIKSKFPIRKLACI